MKARTFVIPAILVLAAGTLFVAVSGADKDNRWNLPASSAAATMSLPQRERLETIPPAAAVVYHQDGYVYVVNKDGTGQKQVTFEKPQGVWEHVAVSPDRRFIAANEQLPNPSGKPGGVSRLWLLDLANGTRTRLLPGFDTAGNGGIDWDKNGFVYFAGKEKDTVAAPTTPAEFKANAGANDVYRVKHDGTGLQRLTRTVDYGEADVSVSADGGMIAYANFNIALETMEIWVAQSDGSAARRIIKGGKNRIASVHDPELSPDNTQIVFSQVNTQVPPNFPNNPDANTAHDIYQARLDGSGLTRLTAPGHISIIPDWQGDEILFLDISEKEAYAGLSMVRPGVADQRPTLIKLGANIGKWIP